MMKKAAGALALAAALLCGPSWSRDTAPEGRSYTIDDLLNQAAFGTTSIDPGDRWVVFEQSAPYAQATRYDYGLFIRAATNVVWIADTGSDAPPRRLLAPSEGVGHVIGDWSPSGRRLLVFRLQDDGWRLGVAEVPDGTVRWLDVQPDVAGFGRVALWRSNDELVLIDRREATLPFPIGWDPEAMILTRERWALQASGSGPSATRLGAGRFAAESPISPVSDLVRLDLRTGAKTVLSSGRFFDLELSPDRNRVAAMTLGSVPPVDQTRPLWPVDKPETRHVQIVDVRSGAIVRPCGDCALAPYLMEWDARSRRVLVWMTGPNGPTSGELAALDIHGRVKTFDRAGLEPDVAASRVASFTTVRALWQGDRPVLRARRGGEGRYDWFRLNVAGPLNLSQTLASPPARIDGVEGQDLLAVADGAAWRIGDDGVATRLADLGPLRPFAPFNVLTPPRLRYNAVGERDVWLGVEGPGRLRRLEEHGGVRVSDADDAPNRDADDTLVTPVAGSATALIEEVERNGVRTLMLRRNAGQGRVLATLNAYLEDVDFAEPVAVPHTGPDGAALTSWLYLPTIHAPGPIPLVVLTYPGDPSPRQRDPAEFMTELNFQQLTAAGYAVLTPSVPRAFFPAEPAEGLATQLLAVVDATLAQHTELDGDRLIYWGQSFGGYSGLVVATQTDRFRTIIVAASVSNLSHKWGEFAPWVRADPRWGLSMRSDAGWAEASQGAMGGPPWSDPDRYVRNSPLFQADRIRTPILIMHGERDMGLSQAEAMFSALWRQNKDVRFITWWGESHIVESAGNLREMYRQILLWLNETSGAPSGGQTSGSPPATGPASASANTATSSPPAPPS